MSILNSISLSDFIKNEEPNNLNLLTVISFEERSTAISDIIIKTNKIPRSLFLFDYDTKTVPIEEYQFLRNKNEQFFKSIFINTDITNYPKTNPFIFNDLLNKTISILNKCINKTLIIDFTCMTRIHIFAIINALNRIKRSPSSILFCYTAPKTYGNINKIKKIGWEDILFVPIGIPRITRREGHARGLILAGYNSERLSVALHEIEPNGGMFVYTKTNLRPDLLKKAIEDNKMILTRLLSLKIHRTDKSMNLFTFNRWEKKIIEIGDVSILEKITNELIKSAVADEGPLILFPFGSKLGTLTAALTIARSIKVDSWAVYPVPSEFKVDYTQGISIIYSYTLSSDYYS